ncbi:MAG TPA: GIY-YIG nuclease family protein, partial [Sandaracinaceae bacterium LLY-WYZ-13_1]|nr:GIY-YIG nuclease family protein [Sandaracinaceae bacterium LLY-WYZ-13_1]
MTAPDRLSELPVLFVDCQSTGATPAHGSLMELGWGWGDGPEVVSRRVRLPEGATVPRRVAKLTGLDDHALRDAPRADEVWRELAARAADAPTAVIHFAPFEERWLRALHASVDREAPFPFEVICTHAIARRLLPELPRRGLRALAGYLGAPVGMLRRSAEHVAATAFVWRALVSRLAAEGVHDRAALRDWLAHTPPAKPLARGWPMPRAAWRGLPDRPGVYRMRRRDGSLLYVGKARSLKARVASYFQKRRGVPDRTLEMLTQARDLDVTETASPLEAALLEHDEIKRHAPPYNVALREADRTCVFASRDLSSFADAPDARHPLGPFVHARPLRALPALVASLAGGDVPPAEALALPEDRAPDEATWRAAL